MSSEIISTIQNSSRMFFIIIALLAMVNLIDALLFTPSENKKRFKTNFAFSILVLILDLIVYKVVYQGMPIVLKDDVVQMTIREFILLGVLALGIAYAVITFVFGLIRMIRSDEKNKSNRNFEIFRTVAGMLAILFMVFTVLRQYDLIIYADRLIEMEANKQYPSLANITGAASNNLFLGLALAMLAIAAIGILIMTLLSLWKEDKYRFSLLVSIILVAVYMILPMYKATYRKSPTVVIKDEMYVEMVKISGIGLMFGLQTGVNINFVLTALVLTGIIGFIACQAREVLVGTTSKLKVTKAIFLLVVAVSFILTSAIGTMGIGPVIAAKEKAIIDLCLNNGSGTLEYTIGVAGLANTLGLALVVFALFSIRKSFVYFVKTRRYLFIGILTSILAIVYLTSVLYSIPGISTAKWNGILLAVGIMSLSNLSIPFLVALIGIVIGIICGYLAQADDLALRKFFRRVAAICFFVVGIVLILGETFIEMALTPQVLTIKEILSQIGAGITVNKFFIWGGILFLFSSVVMVIDGWKKLITSFVKFVREGKGQNFIAIFGGIVTIAVLAIVLLSGTVETQMIETTGTVVTEYKLLDVILGSAKIAGTLGLIIRFGFIAISVLALIGGLLYILGDIVRGKKDKFHNIGFALVFISSLVLLLFNAITSMFVENGVVNYGISLALIGIVLLVVSAITVFKTFIGFFKGVAEFIANNVGLTAALVSFLLIILYILGILS